MAIVGAALATLLRLPPPIYRYAVTVDEVTYWAAVARHAIDQ
ncbi:MAG: hypothetical protein Q4C85_11605 [Actinomyces sp.]|nr:hypothetical protein [Actinomyces sp.]MDO4244370.1 hypothetical protein [Actinomyces sp.]